MADLEELIRATRPHEDSLAPLDTGALLRDARRRRDARRVGLGGAVIALLVVVVPFVGPFWPESNRTVGLESSESSFDDPVDAQSLEGWVYTSVGALEVLHPDGWFILQAREIGTDEPRVVLSTHRLSDEDLHLAFFARDDVRFSDEFPARGVVFVVGGDRTQTPTGPVNALGPQRPVSMPNAYPGQVTAHIGQVADADLALAAYVGPDASPRDVTALERVAASIRLSTTTTETLDGRTVTAKLDRWLGEATTTLLTVELDDDELLSVRTDGDCVGVVQSFVEEDAAFERVTQTSCGVRAPQTGKLSLISVERVFPNSVTGPLSDEPWRTVTLMRVGRGVTETTVQIGPERTAPARTYGGYALAVTEQPAQHAIASNAEGETTHQIRLPRQ